MAVADNYLMLLESDSACNKSQQRNSYLRTVVDDVIIHEQLILTWPHPMRKYTNPVEKEIIETMYLKACPGILIRPSGRFVERSLSEGVVSFWLLRAVVTLYCPNVPLAHDAYYINVDQWIETHTNGGFSEPTGHFPAQSDQDSMHPIMYRSQPDKSVRLDCSRTTTAWVTHHLTGYVRRIRLSWRLSGALQTAQFTSAPETATTTTPSYPLSDRVNILNHTVSPNSSINVTLPSVSSSLRNFQPIDRLLHPDLGVQIRLTSRMLFKGNFSIERKRALCEFFSGFWCQGAGPNLTTQAPHETDREACIQASMRCDKLPDCYPSTSLDGSNVQSSADEWNCDAAPFNYSVERSERLGNSNTTDRWTSKLPWIVLTPLPLVLICALVRICSQKRHLDLSDEGDLDRCRNSSPVGFDVLVVGGGTGIGTDPGSSKHSKLAKPFWVGRRQRRSTLYGPIRTLSSVPEVDERELDLQSTCASGRSEQMRTDNADERGIAADGNGQGKERNETITDSHNTLAVPTSNGIRLLERSRSASWTPKQEFPSYQASAFCSNPVTFGVNQPQAQRRWHHRPPEPETLERRRTFLCWSTPVDPDSSSTSSSRSSTSSSSCSNCRSASKPVVLRSRSCNDLELLSPYAGDLLALNAFGSEDFEKMKVHTDMRKQAEEDHQYVDEQYDVAVPHCWSYTNLCHHDVHPAPEYFKEVTTDIDHKERIQEFARAVTVVAQLAEYPQNSSPKYDERPTSIADPLVQHESVEVNCDVFNADPLDTRSGSRDGLLQLHRAQSPPRKLEK